MRQPKPTTIDYETAGIEGRPDYPPVPCGVSIKYWGKPPKYYAWGHASENNCTKEEAVEALRQAYETPDGILCHNGKFDVDVGEVHMGLPMPPWHKIHDTLFLLFLDDPHQNDLGLKPSSERLLGLPPDERDEVCDWLLVNQPVPGVKISKSKTSDFYYMQYLPYALGRMVGKYCNGDVIRTEGLFKLLWKKTMERNMQAPYDRERELMPILLEMERTGVPVDLLRLQADVEMYSAIHEQCSAWIRKCLKSPELNLDSGAQVIEAMIAAKKINVEKLPLTPTGKYKSDKEAMIAAGTDQQLVSMLRYVSALGTCLKTFMHPWLKTALKSGGLIYTTWNQVRSDESGARTGRLSSTPNFQNIPNEFPPLFTFQEKDSVKRKLLPKLPAGISDLPDLPHCRSYIIPFEGDAFIDRDYCFGPETEVLTDRGFILFEDLSQTDLVAQWEQGVITYARPKAYQRLQHTGDLIHIRGPRTVDLLVTPNHQCLLAKDHQIIFMRADEYPTRNHYQQIHAGTTVGKYKIESSVLRLLAAIQADAAVRETQIRFYLKKERKIERLKQLLQELGIEYKLTALPSKPGFVAITFARTQLTNQMLLLLDLDHGKTFSRLLLGANHEARLDFLMELGLWDGSVKHVGRNWTYASTNLSNVQLVQEMAAITGLRAGLQLTTTRVGRAFGLVSMRTNYLTFTKTFTKTVIPYDGLVHCVTMPAGTVVVRRHGRVMVTGNSQQEPRILAHFDGGALMDKYADSPWVDFHDYAKAELEKMGKFYARKAVKNTNLGLIYGMGVGKLAIKTELPVDETKELKSAILNLYPGLKEMQRDMKVRARENRPIRTWGGREYYCEPPKVKDGKVQTFEYKMVNVLIQGSAADCTKEAIVRLRRRIAELGKVGVWKVLLNVHDQITASVPVSELVEAMEVMREVMEGIEFDVPMLSEGSYSFTDWEDLKDYDKKGKIVYAEAN